MKLSKSSSAVNLKLILVIIGSTIALGTLYYTQNLVSKLQERERQIVQLYANSLEFVVNSDNNDLDYTFIFQNIITRIDFPLILTDANDQIASFAPGSGYKNIPIDEQLSDEEVKKFLAEKIKELAHTNNPISVKSPDGIVIQKIYYGDSDIIRQLKYYPYIQIAVAILFILIAYSSFTYIKRNEQSSIWVGLSKETAHQLGTPISSLMGWYEILKMSYKDPDKVLDTAEEINSDLIRLHKITTRFSKIGSKPELTIEQPYEIIEKVVKYFERRIPQLGKNVVINISGDIDARAKINTELFEWVIENLIKNALDAIENKEGVIDFNIIRNNKFVEIDVKDNGKGIEHKKRKEIFRPGYSTKRRGWGLGLSLSKRIIEDYHKGKISVKYSVINEGTTFKILLKSYA